MSQPQHGQPLLDQLQSKDRLGVLALSPNGFVFDPMNGQSFTLNECGITLLQLLQKHRSVQDVLGELIQRYEVEESRASIALDRFLQQLHKVLS